MNKKLLLLLGLLTLNLFNSSLNARWSLFQRAQQKATSLRPALDQRTAAIRAYLAEKKLLAFQKAQQTKGYLSNSWKRPAYQNYLSSFKQQPTPNIFSGYFSNMPSRDMLLASAQRFWYGNKVGIPVYSFEVPLGHATMLLKRFNNEEQSFIKQTIIESKTIKPALSGRFDKTVIFNLPVPWLINKSEHEPIIQKLYTGIQQLGDARFPKEIIIKALNQFSYKEQSRIVSLVFVPVHERSEYYIFKKPEEIQSLSKEDEALLGAFKKELGKVGISFEKIAPIFKGTKIVSKPSINDLD